MLVEVVVERLARAARGLEACPRPGVPAEGRIPRQVARSLGHAASGGRVRGEQAIGERTVALAHAGDVLVSRLDPREAQALVRVVADEDRRVVEAAGLVEPVLVVRDQVAVDDRPRHAALATSSLEQLFRRERAQCLDGARTCRLGELDARRLRVCEQAHVLTGLRVLVARTRTSRRSARSRRGTAPSPAGDAHSMLTAIPPADSPKIVTLLRIAAERRDVARAPTAGPRSCRAGRSCRTLSVTPRDSSGCARKPEHADAVVMVTTTTPCFASARRRARGYERRAAVKPPP